MIEITAKAYEKTYRMLMKQQQHRTISLAAASSVTFLGLVSQGKLRLVTTRLGIVYDIRAQPYAVFRETTRGEVSGQPTTLVVGFRLKLIGANALLHWLFQRFCILTTPFWSGLSGFRIKLWMINPLSKDYLGIYDWRGREEARTYLDYLLPILRFFSVRGTVWHETLDDCELDAFLATHRLPDMH